MPRSRAMVSRSRGMVGLGMIDRFTLYSSNLLPSITDTTHTCTHIMGGFNSGLTFASQISQMETLR